MARFDHVVHIILFIPRDSQLSISAAFLHRLQMRDARYNNNNVAVHSRSLGFDSIELN